jgi:hypothetical protein
VAQAGYVTNTRDGRRNRYQMNGELPLRHPHHQHRTVAELIRFLQAPSEPSQAFVSVYHAAMVGDTDRDRYVALLREHYARGRLTLEEFASRSDLVLASRSYGDLRGALAGLPVPFDTTFLAGFAGSLTRAAARGALLVALTCAYVVFSLTLALVLVLALLLHDATTSVLLGFLVVWAVPTYLVARMWRSV